MTFIDHIRDQGPETWTKTTYLGFDPDLHCSGFARVIVAHSNRGRKVIRMVTLRDFTVPKRIKGLTAANAMIKELQIHRDILTGDIAVIEGQQIYPPKGAGRDAVAKLVGQGNDLINLAHVSGAARALIKADATIVLPAQWKAQAKKEAMHASALKLIKGVTADLSSIIISIHAADALCMALKKAGFKV